MCQTLVTSVIIPTMYRQSFLEVAENVMCLYLYLPDQIDGNSPCREPIKNWGGERKDVKALLDIFKLQALRARDAPNFAFLFLGTNIPIYLLLR